MVSPPRKLYVTHDNYFFEEPVKISKLPQSAFSRFSEVERREVEKEFPEYSIPQVASIVGDRWRSLGEEKKEKYLKEYQVRALLKVANRFALPQWETVFSFLLFLPQDEMKKYREGLKKEKCRVDKWKVPPSFSAFALYCRDHQKATKSKCAKQKTEELKKAWDMDPKAQRKYRYRETMLKRKLKKEG